MNLVRDLFGKLLAYWELGVYLGLFIMASVGLVLSLECLSIQTLASTHPEIDPDVFLFLSIALAVSAPASLILFVSWYILRVKSRSSAVLALSIGIHIVSVGLLAALAAGPVWVLFHWSTFLRRSSFEAFAGTLVSLALFVLILAAYSTLLVHSRPPKKVLLITKSDQPQLWLALEDISRRCRTHLPDALYWLPTPNAQVELTKQPFFSRRKVALGIGLPLLKLLSEDEFAAVISHELQHLRSADPFVSRCIFQSRMYTDDLMGKLSSPIFRTSLLMLFLIGYSRLHAALSRPLLRQWEFEADGFAAVVTTAGSMARALVKLDLAQTRFDAYYSTLVEPSLNAGYLPPVMAGFAGYYESCSKQENSHSMLLRTYLLDTENSSHPPMHARLDRLSQKGNLLLPADGKPAFDLVQSPEMVEAELYGKSNDNVRQTKWSEEVLTKLILGWKEDCLRRTKRRRGGIELISLDSTLTALPSAAVYLGYERRNVTAVERIVLRMFASALLEDSWLPELCRGRLIFRKQKVSVDPAAEIIALKTRQIVDWRSRCEELGIANLIILPELIPDSQNQARFCYRCLVVVPTGKQHCPKCHRVLISS